MTKDSVLRLSRRKLLTGIAVSVTAAALLPNTSSASDRIVIRNGWVLKESDLT